MKCEDKTFNSPTLILKMSNHFRHYCNGNPLECYDCNCVTSIKKEIHEHIFIEADVYEVEINYALSIKYRNTSNSFVLFNNCLQNIFEGLKSLA